VDVQHPHRGAQRQQELKKKQHRKRKDTTAKQAIKFVFGMVLRAEQAKTRSIIMRGNLVAAEKSAAEKLKVNNLIHLRMKK
jgi:hypothetical protein